MAVFVASQALDMRALFVPFIDEPEISFVTTATLLTITRPSQTELWRGTGFTYDVDGAWTGGTVNSIEFAWNGSAAWSLTGATYSTITLNSFVDPLTDEFDLAGTRAFLFAGNDTITGSPGNDRLGGWNGNDSISGGSGADTLIGDAGNDTLSGGLGNDSLSGGDGNDRYVVAPGDTINETGTVSSTIDVVQSSASWTLGANLERLVLSGTGAINGTGNGLANVITGNAGANRLNGRAGSDSLIGGAGNDTLNGGTGAGTDTLVGGDGNDTYIIDGAELISELGTLLSTSDLVQSSLTYTLGAGLERLTLTGTAALDGTGNTLANAITGNTGANLLTGSTGDDTLNGGSGNDTLVGGAGNDSLTGGTGLDVYRFNAALSVTTKVDRIVGFAAADDTIQLENAIFTGLGAAGALGAAAYRAGTAAADASDRILYDSSTGQIWYDSDGTGAAAKILFATVTAGTVMTVADFVII